MKQSKYLVAAFALAFTLALGFVWSIPASADNLYASIRGTVIDPSGAALPGVKLTATNTATGITYNITSGSAGQFSFLQLPIGDYEVVAEKSGFKRFVAGHIHLDLDQIYALQPMMEVGTATETITVEANLAQVETTSMQLATTVTGNQIVNLPLNGRSWIQLMQLEPGVQGASDRFGNNGGADTYAANGSSTQQNSFLINGTDTNDITLNTPAIIPSPDAIGEFDLVTSTINPEYGRNSGAVINAAIKSGTNAFHGDVFEFYRDTFLDAKPWFATTPSPFHQNEFGGVIGGPIVKDHAFFFFSYQGRRSRRPEPGGFSNAANNFPSINAPPTVPSAAERTGDFSAATGGVPFTCPSTGVCASPFPMVGADGITHPAGTPYATLFPTGVIPTGDLNPLAVNLTKQFIPLPNAANNQFVFNPGQTSGADQYLGRLDEKISNKDSIWFYGLYENDTQVNSLPFIGSSLPGFAESDPNKNYQFTVAWNHTFSPTMLNEARVAYLRYNFNAVNPVTPQLPSAAGFGINPQSTAGAGLPVMSLAGFFSLGFSEDGPQPRRENIYQFTDNLSKVMGHHTLKFGFNMDRIQLNNPFYFDQDGLYTFNGSGLFSTGNPEADFLLGVPDSYFQSSGGYTQARAREYYTYGQDQWQVRPSLTLTFGLAWDLETPYENLFAKGEGQSAFIPGEQSKIFSSAPLGYVFPGDPGVGKYGLANLHWDDLAPRFGFAWSPGSSHKWSIRGGIGLYYNRIEEETELQTLTNPPFSLGSAGYPSALAVSGSTLVGLSAFGNPFASLWTGADGTTLTNGKGKPVTLSSLPAFANPYPFAPPAAGTALSAAQWSQFEPLGPNFAYFAANSTPPRSTNFNLTVQRQIDNSTVATLGYVGAIGRHEEGAADLANLAGVAPGVNPVAAAAGCADFDLPQCAPQTFAFNPFTYGQPGVIFTGINSNYNSLQASIRRQMSNGLQFQVSYTYSRSFDNGSNYENASSVGPGYNGFNLRQSYGPSANDAPQRLVANYAYTLPIYKYTHRLRALTDGWTFTGIATFQSGFPVSLSELALTDLQVAQFSGFAYGFNPPNFVDATGQPLNINHNPRNGKPWVNPAAFAVPALGTIGNANRYPFYGPGLNYWDMALEKSVVFTESKRLELRWEAFDVFNHANFAAPNNLVGTPTFGQVLGVNTAISTLGDGRVVQLAAKFYF